MTLKEYEIPDASFGKRTFQWDKDRDGEVGFPKDAKLVKRGDATVDATANGAGPDPALNSQEPANGADPDPALNSQEPANVLDPDPALNSQEPANVLDQSATGQANQADVDAAKAKEAEEQKAAEEKAAAEKANKAAPAAPANK
ncbi:hypothetical protein SEA_ABIGAIL_7 [Microbacterium phage Abigail]|uniref:hypothetical protein n=1 Tax=Microbacterium phage Abigail TaxID=2851101 RepID=UPI001C7696D9|nr:hypothetical protein QDW37_gp07 [Microbacterium phage Abigail]QXN73507.1 hypothetical protein SEA_ABIGAIL_7 [Microbacterium phage Abigail]